MTIKLTKTQRFQNSFASVELKPEHFNNDFQDSSLRRLGFAPTVASPLIAWGSKKGLTCMFTDSKGRSDSTHYWKIEFLAAAAKKHVELHGSVGEADLPEGLKEAIKAFESSTAG